MLRCILTPVSGRVHRLAALHGWNVNPPRRSRHLLASASDGKDGISIVFQAASGCEASASLALAQAQLRAGKHPRPDGALEQGTTPEAFSLLLSSASGGLAALVRRTCTEICWVEEEPDFHPLVALKATLQTNVATKTVPGSITSLYQAIICPLLKPPDVTTFVPPHNSKTYKRDANANASS